ncbi:MAG: family 20 glycosylhydrolase [Clostridia bacterium]|nr:family 20 glycosylhydrolase [Clostridia bacterium]
MEYRGFMLDVSRHFLPVEDILRIMEGAAIGGMNHMHWHLTDDQGWRLEIRRYPKLTGVGSRRKPAFFGAEREDEHNEGFYTREDVQKIVEAGEKLGLEIVPEIEVPGHASAMLTAYPEFGCRREIWNGKAFEVQEQPYLYEVGTLAGVFPNLICAGKEEALDFLKGILDEVCEMFPGEYVHIGGDEAIKQHWRRCPDCQKRMQEEKLRDEHELQRWLVIEVGRYLAGKGKKTIVWNESLDGGVLPEHFVVQHWWGNDRETEAFMEAGGKVICSDTEAYYISRPYADIDLKKIYETPVTPAWAKSHPEQLLGLECPMWSERVTNGARAEYLLFPRVPAVAWKAMHAEDPGTFEGFLRDMRETEDRIEALGIRGAAEKLWVISPEDAAQEKERMDSFKQGPRMDDTWRICYGLLLQEKLEKLLQAIRMPRPFAMRVMDCAWEEIPEFCGEKQTEQEDGAKIMADQLLVALKNREKGVWEKIPEGIWLDTMGCFTRFVCEHFTSTGRYAFDRHWWTTRQISGKLFRVGELEYELVEGEDPYISLHIPSDAKMDAARLNLSVGRARDFLKEYFPDFAYLEIRCHSWLLSPTLKDLLMPTSRILHFQAAFDLTETDQEDNGAISWVYQLTGQQARDVVLSELPERTTLQKNMKAFLLKGGKAGAAKGKLVRAFED